MIDRISTKRASIPFLAFLFCAAFLLTACSTDNNAVQLTIAGADNFQFTPDTVSIPAASNVTLTFENVGELEHNFILTEREVDPLHVSEADALANITTGIVPGGEAVELNFQAPAPGSYTFVCIVPGHAAVGMVGTLTVTEP